LFRTREPQSRRASVSPDVGNSHVSDFADIPALISTLLKTGPVLSAQTHLDERGARFTATLVGDDEFEDSDVE
jgi:hypothetical protein